MYLTQEQKNTLVELLHFAQEVREYDAAVGISIMLANIEPFGNKYVTDASPLHRQFITNFLNHLLKVVSPAEEEYGRIEGIKTLMSEAANTEGLVFQ